MMTSKKKVFCILRFAKTESAVAVQERSVLSSVVNLQMIMTFLGSIVSLKQLSVIVKAKLNITVPNQWIGRKEPPDITCIAWPPRSPDLMPCDFYLWGFKKDCVYVPRRSADLSDLRYRREADVARIFSDTLKRVWDELAYGIDVCRVTNGAPIERL
ncbi:DUF4817 domain-containing protein [Trichonephila clavipes]|nr:DUF4817 domain-containing protein [Trichonephila clavipes]